MQAAEIFLGKAHPSKKRPSITHYDPEELLSLTDFAHAAWLAGRLLIQESR